jgi:hypothetical protein
MANDLTKRADPTAPKEAEDAASRLKSDLMKEGASKSWRDPPVQVRPR